MAVVVFYNSLGEEMFRDEDLTDAQLKEIDRQYRSIGCDHVEYAIDGVTGLIRKSCIGMIIMGVSDDDA